MSLALTRASGDHTPDRHGLERNRAVFSYQICRASEVLARQVRLRRPDKTMFYPAVVPFRKENQ